MQSPPRRRRPGNDAPTGRALPVVPIVIAVVILGFVIGAGLSVAQRGGGGRTVAVVARTPEPTDAPVTPAPTEKPTPIPTDEPRTAAPAAVATPEPADSSAATDAPATATPAARHSPHATHAPQAAAVTAAATPERAATAAPAPAHTAAPAPAATPAPIAIATPKRVARAVATPAGTVYARPPAAAATDDADSEFGRLSAGVVRAYLAAVERGDTDAAYAQLGAQPGTPGVTISELGIVDPTTRLEHVEARGGTDSVTVNVDMHTAGGSYSGQYTVHRTSTGAAIIVSHAIYKN